MIQTPAPLLLVIADPNADSPKAASPAPKQAWATRSPTLPVPPAAAPPPSPIPVFFPGSVVRVLADTTPGVRPRFAEGQLVAFVSSYEGGGKYYVTPKRGGGKRRKVSGDLSCVRLSCRLLQYPSFELQHVYFIGVSPVATINFMQFWQVQLGGAATVSGRKSSEL